MRRNFTPDETLIDQLHFDNTSAIEELSRRYCYPLYSYCLSKSIPSGDAKKIVRNIFISLWENRADIPSGFSLHIHLYSEVRKAVVQCINTKLNKEIDIPVIEEKIIPGFSVIELQKARQPIHTIQESNYPTSVDKRRYEEPWRNKNSSLSLKGIKYALQNMLNFW
jgi:hypothetical protein